MRYTTNRWQSVVATLQRLSDQGKIEPGQWSELEEAIEEMEHARKIKDWKRLDRAVQKVARIFLK